MYYIHILLNPMCLICPSAFLLPFGNHWFVFCICESVFHTHSFVLFFLLLLFSHTVVSNSLRPQGLQHARLPFPSPGDHPDQSIELTSSALAGGFFTTEPPEKEATVTKLLSMDAYKHLLFSLSVMSESLQPHGLQHARLPCPSPSSRACSNSCPLNR